MGERIPVKVKTRGGDPSVRLVTPASQIYVRAMYGTYQRLRRYGGWALMLLAGVCPGAAAFWCYSYVQRQLGVARASSQLYLGPLYGAAMAWLFLGEPVGWHHAAGAALILPGIWLVSQRPPAAPPPPEDEHLAEEHAI